MAISIFAKRAFLNTKPSQPFEYDGTKPARGYLKRLSSTVRGEQIAQAIGAKFNPKSGYQDDVCIYIKPVLDENGDFKFEGKSSYLDICDNIKFVELVKKHLELSVIAASEWNYELLKRLLPNTKIVLIPQQHCNYERKKRVRKEITVVGAIGSWGILGDLPADLESRLHERGMKFIEFSQFFTREDVIDFYMQIDVQIIWRPSKDYGRDILMNSLKLQNSASFGIPTICYDEPVFKEMDGCYIPVKTLDEFFGQLDKLRSNPDLYDQYSKKCLEKAEEFHIEKIGELYKSLT